MSKPTCNSLKKRTINDFAFDFSSHIETDGSYPLPTDVLEALRVLNAGIQKDLTAMSVEKAKEILARYGTAAYSGTGEEFDYVRAEVRGLWFNPSVFTTWSRHTLRFSIEDKSLDIVNIVTIRVAPNAITTYSLVKNDLTKAGKVVEGTVLYNILLELNEKDKGILRKHGIKFPIAGNTLQDAQYNIGRLKEEKKRPLVWKAPFVEHKEKRNCKENRSVDLPFGWTTQIHNGKVLYIDHNTRTTTWTDPRVVSDNLDDEGESNDSESDTESIQDKEKDSQGENLKTHYEHSDDESGQETNALGTERYGDQGQKEPDFTPDANIPTGAEKQEEYVFKHLVDFINLASQCDISCRRDFVETNLRKQDQCWGNSEVPLQDGYWSAFYAIVKHYFGYNGYNVKHEERLDSIIIEANNVFSDGMICELAEMFVQHLWYGCFREQTSFLYQSITRVASVVCLSTRIELKKLIRTMHKRLREDKQELHDTELFKDEVIAVFEMFDNSKPSHDIFKERKVIENVKVNWKEPQEFKDKFIYFFDLFWTNLPNIRTTTTINLIDFLDRYFDIDFVVLVVQKYFYHSLQIHDPWQISRVFTEAVEDGSFEVYVQLFRALHKKFGNEIIPKALVDKNDEKAAMRGMEIVHSIWKDSADGKDLLGHLYLYMLRNFDDLAKSNEYFSRFARKMKWVRFHDPGNHFLNMYLQFEKERRYLDMQENACFNEIDGDKSSVDQYQEVLQAAMDIIAKSKEHKDPKAFVSRNIKSRVELWAALGIISQKQIERFKEMLVQYCGLDGTEHLDMDTRIQRLCRAFSSHFAEQTVAIIYGFIEQEKACTAGKEMSYLESIMEHSYVIKNGLYDAFVDLYNEKTKDETVFNQIVPSKPRKRKADNQIQEEVDCDKINVEKIVAELEASLKIFVENETDFETAAKHLYTLLRKRANFCETALECLKLFFELPYFKTIDNADEIFLKYKVMLEKECRAFGKSKRYKN